MISADPQPQRFEVYNLLKGGRGFFLKDAKFIYKINRQGGFYDQFGNYYDKYGDSAPDPTNGEPTDDESSIYSFSSSEQEQSEEDDYAEYASDPIYLKVNKLVRSEYSEDDSQSYSESEDQDFEKIVNKEKETEKTDDKDEKRLEK